MENNDISLQSPTNRHKNKKYAESPRPVSIAQPSPLEIDDNDNDDDEKQKLFYNNQSNVRKSWIIFSNLITCCFSDCCLSENLDIRQAWREKVAFLIIIAIVGFSQLIAIAVVPKLLCPDHEALTWKYIDQSNDQLMVLRGHIYKVNDFITRHPSAIEDFNKYLGQDVTHLFQPPSPHLNQPEGLFIYPELESLFAERVKNDTEAYCNLNYCHPYTNQTWDDLYVGPLIVDPSIINNDKYSTYTIIYDKVYNLSNYITYGHGVYPSKYDYVTQRRDIAYYLDERLNATLMNRLNQDATALFEDKFTRYQRSDVITYLDQQFLCGQIDLSFSVTCNVLNYLYLAVVCIMVCIVGIKFLSSLWLLYRQYPKCKQDYVIVNIPCYTESETAMIKTIDSVYNSKYINRKKLLFIICDGMIRGKGNSKSTAEITLGLFNRNMNDEDLSYQYDSIGADEKSTNRAQVYCGWHQIGEQKLPYVVVVKVGTEHEQNSSRRGNRGKRDSQLILLQLLSQLFYENFDGMNDLQKAINRDLTAIDIHLNKYKYLLSLDADTYCYDDALLQMMNRMKDPKIIALCGETQVANRLDNWVTSIQVYEYYVNHMLNKAFESTFSSVTCLPGCFSFYRLYTDEGRRKPLIIKKELLEDYSNNNANTLHLKNLLDLGEDRYFTTLINRYFPTWKIKFVAEAKCLTNVPNQWSILLSQRRRWINSTIHNLFELMLLPRLCGICLFSMKFLVLMDIYVTFSLPVLSCYFIYLLYLFASGSAQMPLVFMIAVGSMIAVQILIFVIKRDFVYIIWFFIYILSFPIWTIILPTYAFFKMDDFSWGTTHKVAKETIQPQNQNPTMPPIENEVDQV